MSDGDYQPTTYADPDAVKNPLDELVQAIQSLSTSYLEDGQKPIPVRYLAIRNALGDFRTKGEPNAFFQCEVKKNGAQWQAKGTGLVDATKVVRLLKADGTRLVDADQPIIGTSFTIDLADEQAANALALVEAYDRAKILLQIGIPTR
jgi:hypothetical protein